MPRRLPRLLVLLALLLGGALGGCNPREDRPLVTTNTDTASLQHRRELNEAYSLIYGQARGLSRLEWLMRFKRESAATRETVKAATDYYATLTRDLDRLAAQHPALSVDVPALLPIHGRARERIIREQVESALPLVGDSGLAYERGLLMLIHSALGEQRHVAALIAQEETDASLRGFMQVQSQTLDGLYRRFDEQLRRDHYR